MNQTSNLDKLSQEILSTLFEGYLQYGGTATFSLADITEQYNVDSHEIGRELVKMGWIKHQEFGYEGFRGAISSDGIKAIQPNYFDRLIDQILISAGLTKDWVDIISTLNWDGKDYQRAFDLGKEIEERGIAEVRYHHDEVWLKLNSLGIKIYNQKNQGGFQNYH